MAWPAMDSHVSFLLNMMARQRTRYGWRYLERAIAPDARLLDLKGYYVMSDTIDSLATGEPPPDMTLASAQRVVDASIMALGGYWPPLANLARLFEECGELARVINQIHGPKQVKPGERQSELAEELGDALYTLLVLANSLDVDAGAALRQALAKTGGRAQPPISPPGAPSETDL